MFGIARRLICFFSVSLTCLAQVSAIVNVNVVDVERGEIRAGQTVVVSEGNITAIGPSASVAAPANAARIPGEGRYVIPGLWDMHVHLRSDQAKPYIRMVEDNASLLDLFLPNGVIGIREMGGDIPDDVMRWRKEIKAGTRPGPRILTAGRKIDNDPPAWAGSLGVKTEIEAREAVRQLKQSGADFVKVYFRTVAPDVFRAVIDEAHNQHLKVTGHKPGNMSLQELIETGIDGMQHGEYLPATDRAAFDALVKERAQRAGTAWAMDATEGAARLIAMQDKPEGERLYKLMAEKGFWVTPTLAVYTHTLEYGIKDYDGDDRRRYFSAAIWNTWDPKVGFRKPPDARALAVRTEGVKRWEAAALAAFKAGVPMLVGTDCGANNVHVMPGWSVHEEMQALVRIGLTPAEVLRMATVNPAKWRGDSEREGTIEKGKVADMVLLRANPLTAISHTQEIDGVFQGGRYYSRTDLDAMLKRAESRAK